jgi:hypothetical protein
VNFFASSKFRQWLYGVVVAMSPILVTYGVVNKDDIALWVALAGAVLAAGTAFTAVTQQRHAGTLPDYDPPGKHARKDDGEPPDDELP